MWELKSIRDNNNNYYFFIKDEDARKTKKKFLQQCHKKITVYLSEMASETRTNVGGA